MSGKIIGGGIALIALIFGVAIYYLQVYHYYDEVEVLPEELTLATANGVLPIGARDVRAINAGSSPIRFRACFQTSDTVPEGAIAYPRAEPLNAPGWFDCFDATEIGDALSDGSALAYLGAENFSHGVDRVFAVIEDGRGFVWHQVNEEIKK